MHELNLKTDQRHGYTEIAKHKHSVDKCSNSLVCNQM